MIENSLIGSKGSLGLAIKKVVIGIAVLGILLVVASPLVAHFSSGYRLRAAVREVATDLRFARLLAVKENKEIQVVFNSSSYQVVRVSDGLIAKSRSFIIDYPEVTLSPLAITFNSGGNSNSQTITVSSPRRTKNITVGSTGRVRLG